MTSVPRNVIYGLRLIGEDQYRYVGLTTRTAPARFTQHIYDARRGNTEYPVQKWIVKHGADAVECIVLQECPGGMDELNAAEIAWIAALGTFVADGGLNCTKGGEGRVGHTQSAETRAKIGLAHRGRVMSPETRAKLSAAHQGLKRTAESRAKQSATSMGRPGPQHTPETRARISAALQGRTGKPQTPEARAKQSAAMMGRRGRGPHTLWHANRGVVKPGCFFCDGDSDRTPAGKG